MQLRTFSALLGASVLFCAGGAIAATIRVADYNIEADVNGNTTPNTGLSTVLEAMGEANTTGNVAAHPLDILGLEETSSNSATVAPIVTALNSYYGSAAVYAQSTVQATQSGSATTGNGPNAIVYNTSTLTLLNSIGIVTPTGSSNGVYRQVMRYEFQPVGGAAKQDFYVYVSHMKSSGGDNPDTADQALRAKEGVIIHNDEASLPAGSSFLTMGDFNLDGSEEAAYQSLLTGNYDPGNPTGNLAEDWTTAAYKTIQTDSVTDLSYRDDIEMMSLNVSGGTSTALSYLSGSSRIFGNNGSIAEGGKVTASNNTALAGLTGSISAASAYSALSTASDHYPVVADYTIVAVPEPITIGMITFGMLTLVRRRSNVG